jgi:hypothetical protein
MRKRKSYEDLTKSALFDKLCDSVNKTFAPDMNDGGAFIIVMREGENEQDALEREVGRNANPDFVLLINTYGKSIDEKQQGLHEID